jgi:hypothetical protein
VKDTLMSSLPLTAILRTSAQTTRMLVRFAEDEILKAVLPTPSSKPHHRALPSLFEAIALWHQSPLRVVLSASEEDLWRRFGLLDEFFVAEDTVHYTIELRERAKVPGQRIAGLGKFDDLRQLVLGGVR